MAEGSRVNAALTPVAAAALARLVERTGYKRVKVVNRALPVYDLVDAELRAGNELVFRSPDGTLRVVDPVTGSVER